MIEQIKLINDFTAQYLLGDIERLATFELEKIRYDKVYGCPGRNPDSDDTNLMRAIYLIVFGEAWGIEYKDLEDMNMRGDTINTYSTLFSRPWQERFIDIWHPDKEFLAKRFVFQKTCYTPGNMTILPNIPIGEWTINKHRGCHDEWHDYEDRFLAALRLVLLNDAKADLDLKELVDLNRKYFLPFYGEQGWRNFIDGNMLEYYVDDKYVPIITSKGYTYWRGGYTNRSRFFEECHRYMDFSTNIINDRAKRIIDKLKATIGNYKD